MTIQQAGTLWVSNLVSELELNMYRITLNDEILLQTDSPRWVKLNPASKAWIQCNFQSAECIAVDGKRYSIDGRPLAADAPDVVSVKYVDAAQNALDNERAVDLLFFALTNIINDINNRLTD